MKLKEEDVDKIQELYFDADSSIPEIDDFPGVRSCFDINHAVSGLKKRLRENGYRPKSKYRKHEDTILVTALNNNVRAHNFANLAGEVYKKCIF